MIARRTTGFTLVEVLVSVAVLGISASFLSVIINALNMNASSSATIRVNQAGQTYLESVQNAWRRTSYGELDADNPAPTTLDRYTWTVTLCQLDATFACQNVVTATQPDVPSYSAPPASTNLMRVTISYVPKGTRSGAPITATAEVARQ